MPQGWLRVSLAEFLGTFALIFVGAGAIIVDASTGGKTGIVGIAFAHGLAIALGVAALGHISGAHFNPAVTAAFLATRRMAVPTGVIYIVSQLIGATVAAAILKTLFPAAAVNAVHLGTPMLNEFSFVSGVVLELILTAFLVLAVFGTAVDPRGARGIAALAIGLTITLDIFAGGPFTGAAMNPARAFGPAMVSGTWDGHLVYWIGPILGGVIMGLVYEHVLMQRDRT